MPVWSGRLKIPWVSKSVGSGFLPSHLISYHRHDITKILLLWRKTTNKQNKSHLFFYPTLLLAPLPLTVPLEPGVYKRKTIGGWCGCTTSVRASWPSWGRKSFFVFSNGVSDLVSKIICGRPDTMAELVEALFLERKIRSLTLCRVKWTTYFIDTNTYLACRMTSLG